MNSRESLTFPLPQIPDDLVSIADYERYSTQALPHDVLEYINGGAADDLTMHRNRSAFDQQTLYNRITGDFSLTSTHTSIAGYPISSPIILAPVAHQQLVHPDGELATAMAAAASDVPMICSTLSHHSFTEISQRHQQCWFQLYWQPVRQHNEHLLKLAHQSGARAIVITLDAPVNGLRNRAQRAGFSMPGQLGCPNLDSLPPVPQKTLSSDSSVIFQGLMCDRPSAEDLAWLRANTDLPLFAKGISHPDDAAYLQQMGYDGIIVSNHGGRTLDGLPASIEILPAIRDRLGDKTTILLDSGVRRGTDILKALALGADAVCIGRPQVWALATAGALGVAHMLRILQQELEVAMALTGCTSVDAITRDVLFTAGDH